MVGIYKITNQLTRESYIGQSNNIERRWSEHRKKMKILNTQLYQAMRLYGIQNFSFEVLEECNITELNEREKFYIQKYDTLNCGYNMSTIENLQYKINWNIVDEIIDKLKNNSLLESDIAKEYNVSCSLISQINMGKMWRKDSIQYPIREVLQRVDKRNYCVDCGKEISKNAVRCVQCDGKKKIIISERISRNELKNLIREKSFSEIGRIYHVSDNAVRRWCETYKLPRTKKEINSYTNEQWEMI